MGTARSQQRKPEAAAPKAAALQGGLSGPANSNPNRVQRPEFEEETSVRGPDDRMEDDTKVRGDDTVEPPTEKMSGDTAVVTASSLHLREGAGIDNASIKELPKGTVVTRHAKKGKWYEVKAWSSFKGLKGWVHGSHILVQPDLTPNEDTKELGDPDPYVYEQVVGQPFHGTPNAKQATQGSIGDCYLIAAMGALAAQPAGQKELMRMIKPNGPAKSYTVVFKEEKWDGTYKDVPIKVDTWMPVNDGKLKFALNGKGLGDLEKVPLWPVILEKAYAQWKGGYDALDKGGSPGGAMSEIAGADVKNQYVSYFKKDEDLLAAVGKAIDAGQALTAASNSKVTRQYTTLSGSAEGPYTANMKNKGDPGSFSVTDGKGKAPWVFDQKDGKLASDPVGEAKEKAEGTVEYGQKTYKVDVSLKYPKDHGPKDDGDLALEFDAQYWLSDTPKICGNHAYIVEGKTDKGIKLANPWGSYHPGEVPIDVFRKCFYSFAGVELLDKDDPSV